MSERFKLGDRVTIAGVSPRSRPDFVEAFERKVKFTVVDTATVVTNVIEQQWVYAVVSDDYKFTMVPHILLTYAELNSAADLEALYG